MVLLARLGLIAALLVLWSAVAFFVHVCAKQSQITLCQHNALLLLLLLLSQMHGLFAKAAVNGVTELLPLIADQSGLPDGTRQVLELLHTAATQLMAGIPAGMWGGGPEGWGQGRAA
jgi:hypothetical protein